MDETKQRKKLEPVISGGAEIKKNTDPQLKDYKELMKMHKN